MFKFPMTFEVEANSGPGVATNWVAQENHLPPIQSAIPPQFMGPGGGYSPEDLFGIAVLNCLIATYKVYCERAKVVFAKIEGKAVVTLDKEVSSLHISHIEVFLDVSGASNVDKAKEMLDAAIRDCAISNSIKSSKTFHKKVIP